MQNHVRVASMKWKVAFIAIAVVGLAPLTYAYYGWFSHNCDALDRTDCTSPRKTDASRI